MFRVQNNFRLSKLTEENSGNLLSEAMDFIAIDFETATSDRDSPCEIGLTLVKDGHIQETKSWLVKPPCYPHFHAFNISIHGIKPQDVKDSPTFDQLWPELLPYFENQFLIAHNAGFDFSVLRRTLDTYNLSYPSLNYSCSYIFSRKVWAGMPAYDLKSLCKAHNIEFSHHRAGADSRAAAELSLKAFECSGVTCLEDFPDKLQTIPGSLFLGGYKPSETKRNHSKKDLTKIVGDPSKHNPESLFYGRTVVFTGTLTSMARNVAFQKIVDIGGIIANSVTKNTDFLVVGQQDYRVVGDDGMSSKQEKAVKLVSQGASLEVISEDEFLRNL